MALFAGYFGLLVRWEKRVVSDELMQFHRREQLKKLKAILVSIVRLKKIDSFNLLPVKHEDPPGMN